ncbi:MAG: phosphoenolpyruvate carboxylase [Planctomycetaceae bacterium]
MSGDFVVSEPVSPAADAETMEQRAQRTLSADIHFLGGILGDTIRRLAGPRAFDLVETIRAATKSLREQPSPAAAAALRRQLSELTVPELRMLIRAFSIYFDLINLAEQRVRLRVLRWQATDSNRPASDGLEAALAQLKDSGVSVEAIENLLNRGLIVPVFTAHPSEARRRTILEKLDHLADLTDRFDAVEHIAKDRELVVARISEEVEIFWLTNLVRSRRPDVLDEVRQSIGMIETLFDIVPSLYREFESSLQKIYAETPLSRLAPFLQFGTWIGGDRDGHPRVVHSVTIEAVRLQQETLLQFYLSRIDELGSRLSISDMCLPVAPEFQTELQSENLAGQDLGLDRHEPFRSKCRSIAKKLRRTLATLPLRHAAWPTSADLDAEDAGVYRKREEFLKDLWEIKSGLEQAGAVATARGQLDDLIRLVEVFGLHMLTMDIRQHSQRHGQALAEIFAKTGVCADYLRLTPAERYDCLAKELHSTRPLITAELAYSPETCEVVQTFRSIAAILEGPAPEAIENYIIQFRHRAGACSVLLFARGPGCSGWKTASAG